MGLLRHRLCRIYVLMAALLLSMLMIFATKSVSHADPSPTELTYVSIRINEGDTINKIASAHLSDSGMNHTELVNEITRLNRLPDDSIRAGAYLVVPVLLTENF